MIKPLKPCTRRRRRSKDRASGWFVGTLYLVLCTYCFVLCTLFSLVIIGLTTTKEQRTKYKALSTKLQVQSSRYKAPSTASIIAFAVCCLLFRNILSNQTIMTARLNVNIDHVATVRQARRAPEPSVIAAA